MLFLIPFEFKFFLRFEDWNFMKDYMSGNHLIEKKPKS